MYPYFDCVFIDQPLVELFIVFFCFKYKFKIILQSTHTRAYPHAIMAYLYNKYASIHVGIVPESIEHFINHV